MYTIRVYKMYMSISIDCKCSFAYLTREKERGTRSMRLIKFSHKTHKSQCDQIHSVCMTKIYANAIVYNSTDMVHKVEQKVINRHQSTCHQPWSRHYDEALTRYLARKMLNLCVLMCLKCEVDCWANCW